MKFFKNKKGFTLVELVVVIAILGILAGIAIPRFMDATASARGSKIVADMRTIDSAATMKYAKDGSWPANIAALVTANLLANEPKPQTGDIIFPAWKKVTGSTATSYGYDTTANRATFTAGGTAYDADDLSAGGSAKS